MKNPIVLGLVTSLVLCSMLITVWFGIILVTDFIEWVSGGILPPPAVALIACGLWMWLAVTCWVYLEQRDQKGKL